MKRGREPSEPTTLLVGISNPATVHRLAEISSIVSGVRSVDILLTHVVTVANQISLTTGRSSPEVVRARDFLRQTQKRADALSLNARGLVEVARSVDEGLLAAAESHRADMILVGFSEWEDDPEGGEEEKFDRTMYRVARKAHTDVVVAKFRRDVVHRVLVPVATGGQLELVPFLARAFSQNDGTSVTFLHVEASHSSITKGSGRLGKWLTERGLNGVGKSEVILSDDPVEAILDESRNHDMVIVGPSKRPNIMDGIFSSKARTVAEETPASVLMAWDRVASGGS